MDKIIIGSTYFFLQYPNFSSHDLNYIEIIYSEDFRYKRTIRGQGKDIFQINSKNIDTLLDFELTSTLPLVVGKYLVPEFCKVIGFTISDLPKLKPLIDSLDKKHEYEKIIYNAYIQNESFTLTDSQRLEAYKSYCLTRNIINKESEV